MKLQLNELKSSKNIAELLDKDELDLIGEQVFSGYSIDEDSRADWKELVDKAMDIAKQKMEPKNTPWPNASNIKFPLITQACIQFAARVMPEIIQNDRVVKASIIGQDIDGAKYRRADRVSTYMSYQLINNSNDWEDGTDKLLHVLPVLGTVFKKTYYNEREKRVISELCVPEKIVVNYNTQSIESARRITHIITMYKNDIIERQRTGIFTQDIDFDLLIDENDQSKDDDSPIDLLEQHCYIDLDGDGYKEPYIVTVHKESRQVLRIVNRFDYIEKSPSGEVICIGPIEYFTDFHFIRSPDGGFYSVGFGTLLLPLNSSINTLINQLLDAGTLSNMQGGFLGRGLRIKNGDIKIKMGEWKVLDAASGTNIAQNVFPIPVREPSQTLYQLLGLMLQVGKDLSSATDVLQGKQPAQNVAQGTLSQLVEQGTKIFTAINKRFYRGLKKEYEKVYKLDSVFLKNSEYMKVLDDPEANVKKDFELYSLDILPVADPVISSDTQRINKAVMLHQMPSVDKREADKYILESMHIEKQLVDKLIPAVDPNAPPPPQTQLIMAQIQKIQAEIAEISATATLNAEDMARKNKELELKNASLEQQLQESAARVWKMQKDAEHGDVKVAVAAGKMQSQELLKGAQFAHKQDKDAAEIQLKAASENTKAEKVRVESKKIDKEKDDKK